MASEVQPGWWVGGCYAYQLNKKWAGIVDLTVEFPEKCRNDTLRYLCLPTWDGVPCSPEQLEKAANFCIEAREEWERLVQSQSSLSVSMSRTRKSIGGSTAAAGPEALRRMSIQQLQSARFHAEMHGAKEAED